MTNSTELHGPLPSLGTKVTFDGIEGRVRGHVQGRHADYSRLVVVELKKGFFANTGQQRPAPGFFAVGGSDVFISAMTVHASNLLDSDGQRRWARPEELGV